MFIFTPWRSFKAFIDRQAKKIWLNKIANDAVTIFKKGMRGPHSGRVYRGKRSSSPGEYPASQSGRLIGSIRKQVTANEATIGSNVAHSIYLRNGTSKMKRRKMSDNAMAESIARNRGIGRFAGFRHG